MNELTIAYESEFYKIEVDYESNLLRAMWYRPVSEQEMIKGGTKLYEVLRDTKIANVLANAQSMSSLTPQTKEWMSTTFYKLLSQTNIRKLARVLPQNKFHQLGLESVITRAEALGGLSFAVRNFSNDRAALRWIQEDL